MVAANYLAAVDVLAAVEIKAFSADSASASLASELVDEATLQAATVVNADFWTSSDQKNR